MGSMAVMAVIVFIALFFFKAGYGYLSTSNWGPKISNRTAWVLMEAPAFIFLLYYTIRFAISGLIILAIAKAQFKEDRLEV